jgi:Peptidase family M20/M25/M40
MAPVKDLELPRLDSVLASLGDYVAIPGDSRNADRDTMRRAADWIAGQLSFAGGHVEETGGHPDESEWLSPPFHLTVDGDIARGRGVSDDKGPVFLVVAMLQAAIAQRGGSPLNVKFLIEGEDEIGSPHLTGLANVVRHLGLLGGDPSPVRPPREHQGWHWIRTPVGGWWEPAVLADGLLLGLAHGADGMR